MFQPVGHSWYLAISDHVKVTPVMTQMPVGMDVPNNSSSGRQMAWMEDWRSIF